MSRMNSGSHREQSYVMSVGGGGMVNTQCYICKKRKEINGMQKGIKTIGYISGVGLFGNRHRIEGTVLSGGGVPELVLQRVTNIDL